MSPELFQWLYECVSLKKKSSKLFVFVMQFVPDLLYLYLTCVSENLQKVQTGCDIGSILLIVSICLGESASGSTVVRHHKRSVALVCCPFLSLFIAFLSLC